MRTVRKGLTRPFSKQCRIGCSLGTFNDAACVALGTHASKRSHLPCPFETHAGHGFFEVKIFVDHGLLRNVPIRIRSFFHFPIFTVCPRPLSSRHSTRISAQMKRASFSCFNDFRGAAQIHASRPQLPGLQAGVVELRAQSGGDSNVSCKRALLTTPTLALMGTGTSINAAIDGVDCQ